MEAAERSDEIGRRLDGVIPELRQLERLEEKVVALAMATGVDCVMTGCALGVDRTVLEGFPILNVEQLKRLDRKELLQWH
jgi:hypothetical protein